MKVVDLEDYKRKARVLSKHDKEYASARSKLNNWTCIHEIQGNKFSLDQMHIAIEYQKNRYDGKRCKHSCCRLWAVVKDDCYLHHELARRQNPETRVLCTPGSKKTPTSS